MADRFRHPRAARAGVTRALATALPLVLCATGTISIPAADAATPDSVLEGLQRCLDAQGFGQRIWSITELNQKTRECLGSTQVPPSCPSSPFTRELAVNLRFSEPHPTWSANDRARLADQLPRWLDASIRQQPQVRTLTDNEGRLRVGAPPQAPWHLEVTVTYGGSGWSQRDLDDWVRQPRSLQIDLQLHRRDDGAIKDVRQIKQSFAPRLRARDADTSTARWMTELEAGVRTAASELLATLGCEAQVLEVARTEGPDLRVAFGELRLRPGQTEFGVALIPADGQLPAALWPKGRVTANGALEGSVVLFEGDEELCQRERCVAIPLPH